MQLLKKNEQEMEEWSIPLKQLSNIDNLIVLYEDNHIIAVNKRVGDIVQGDFIINFQLNKIL